MSTAAAFKASYADWKLIKTRGCVQVVLEVPLHEADAAYQALGGMPDPAMERWFGIARLDEKRLEASAVREAEVAPETSRAPLLPAPAPRHHKPVAADKRLAQQAGIACADTLFQKYLYIRNKIERPSEGLASAAVRFACGVMSRSEIKPGTPAGDEWQKLYGAFLLWRDVPESASLPSDK